MHVLHNLVARNVGLTT